MIDDFVGYRFFRIDAHSSLYNLPKEELVRTFKGSGAILYFGKNSEKYVKVPHYFTDSKNVSLIQYSLTEVNALQFTLEVKPFLTLELENQYMTLDKVEQCFALIREDGGFPGLTDEKLKFYLKGFVEKHEHNITFDQLIEKGYPRALKGFSSRLLETVSGPIYSKIMDCVRS